MTISEKDLEMEISFIPEELVELHGEREVPYTE